METNQYVVLAGKVPHDQTGEELSNLFEFVVTGRKAVKDVYTKWVQVVPDDMEETITRLDEWNEKEPFIMAHEDDDFFIFRVTPLEVGVPKDFQRFVDEFHAGDPDEY